MLLGTTMGPLKLVSTPHIKKDLKHTSIVVASHIFSMQLELVTYESLKEVVVEEMSKELQGLLNKYEGIFLETQGLVSNKTSRSSHSTVAWKCFPKY